jgi:CubicO group peptidase (beta-lactamase class C family)
MQRTEGHLQELLQAEREQGYFSTAYVECGFLDQAEAKLQIFLSSEAETAQIFDLASLTKALVTGPLVHQLLTDRKLPFSAPLKDWAPPSLRVPASFLQLPTEEILAHISGLPAWWNFWIQFLDKSSVISDSQALTRMQEVLQRIPLHTEKGDHYSDVGYILLGCALGLLKQQSLSQQFQTLLRAMHFPQALPLGFAPDLALDAKYFVPTGYCAIRERVLRGEVHDENCAAFGGISGHAGLFGTGEAVSSFLKLYAASSAGRAYFMANEQARLSTSREGLLGLRRGHGLSAAVFADGQSMGHLGFTGTAFWLEWSTQKYAIFLSNRVVSGRVSTRMTELRKKVFQLLDERLD